MVHRRMVEKRYFSKEQNDFHFMYILKKLMLILFLRITKKMDSILCNIIIPALKPLFHPCILVSSPEKKAYV